MEIILDLKFTKACSGLPAYVPSRDCKVFVIYITLAIEGDQSQRRIWVYLPSTRDGLGLVSPGKEFLVLPSELQLCLPPNEGERAANLSDYLGFRFHLLDKELPHSTSLSSLGPPLLSPPADPEACLIDESLFQQEMHRDFEWQPLLRNQSRSAALLDTQAVALLIELLSELGGYVPDARLLSVIQALSQNPHLSDEPWFPWDRDLNGERLFDERDLWD